MGDPAPQTANRAKLFRAVLTLMSWIDSLGLLTVLGYAAITGDWSGTTGAIAWMFIALFLLMILGAFLMEEGPPSNS